MTLPEWAILYGVSDDALRAMQDILIEPTLGGSRETANGSVGSEAAVSQDIRLDASRQGIRLFRNNVGACVADDGRHIRWRRAITLEYNTRWNNQ